MDCSETDLETITISGKRYYVTPSGNYPSVTTVLALENAEAIEKWRDRVGEQEAARVSKRAADRGTIVHDLMERHIKGEDVVIKSLLPFHAMMFLPIRNYIDKHLRTAIHAEVPLYSHKMKVAGRVDLIGEFDEGIEIVDYKTAQKEKQQEYIKHYFMQAAAYAYMYKELYGVQINRYRILIVDEYGGFQPFVGNTADHIKDFAMVRMRFFKETNT